MSLKTRIHRLEQSAPAAEDPGGDCGEFARYVELVLDGFDDVRAWLDGEAPAPDPHRLGGILKGNLGAGIGFDNVEYFLALWSVVRLICMERTAEQTGEPIPEDLAESDRWLMARHDKVTGSLLYNADKWLDHAEGLAAGTIAKNTPLIGELVVIPYIPGECGPDCRWASPGPVMRFVKTDRGDPVRIK